MSKKIMLVGGGSGGHLTPLIAVATEIHKLDSTIDIVHVGQKNENLQDVLSDSHISASFQISAGKFRRYHGKSLFSHLLDVKTILFNFRDLFRFMVGTIQAWRLLGRVKPVSIMLKGGFVCVPVGFAARMRRIPYITHDSDAVPGLANRITAKHASYNTTALPAILYPYNQSKTIQVGIPIRHEFSLVTNEQMKKAKTALSINPEHPVLFSVGGGLGAQRLNQALVVATPELFTQIKNLEIIHLTGKKLYKETVEQYKKTLTSSQLKSVKILDFTSDLFKFSAAADVVLTRGGATNIAEFAAQAKPCVVVPNPMLTGGQQLHNAKVLADAGAAVILHEDKLSTIANVLIKQLTVSTKDNEQLGQKLHNLAVFDSASKLATLLIKLAGANG